jgi:hypothetical protein
MPPHGLPGNADLEQMRSGAKSFARAVRSRDAGAAEVVREFHPRLGSAQAGSPELDAFKLSDGLLVVARRFGFASWPKLKAHLELVARYKGAPHEIPPSEDRAAEFLRLVCPHVWEPLLYVSYNCSFGPGDDWLELLFEFGLGDGDGGPWKRLRRQTLTTAPARSIGAPVEPLW